MSEQREIKAQASHALQRPHLEMPKGFVPLRLYDESQRIHIELNQPMVLVGRHSGAGLCLAFPQVSRRHCRFVFENGQWRLYDLNSLNGIFLNDELIVEATLYAGQRLRIGECNLLIEAATPVRTLPVVAAADQDEKLQQIIRMLPTDPTEHD